jgi:hypothetical protein
MTPAPNPRDFRDTATTRQLSPANAPRYPAGADTTMSAAPPSTRGRRGPPGFSVDQREPGKPH